MGDNTEQIGVQSVLEIDAGNVPYRELNTRLRNAVVGGTQKLVVRNVHGQRYIGTNLGKPVEIEIYGSPGNDLGAFMDGPRIIVHGNAQGGCGNTMNSGEIIVHGRAGGILTLLGLTLKADQSHAANFIGTGMHGGLIYLRGAIEEHQLGKEVDRADLDEKDLRELRGYVTEFAGHFGYDADEIMSHKFTRLFPLHLRPNGTPNAY